MTKAPENDDSYNMTEAAFFCRVSTECHICNSFCMQHCPVVVNSSIGNRIATNENKLRQLKLYGTSNHGQRAFSAAELHVAILLVGPRLQNRLLHPDIINSGEKFAVWYAWFFKMNATRRLRT